MPISLYQKYRPKRFEDLVGQEHVVKILQAEITQNKLAHAYIFIGPRGTGKTTTARIFANAVNCQNPDTKGNPCGKCNVCKAVEQNRFLDLIEIDAASNRGVDNIRELKEKVNMAPVMGKYKVYIIDEVHMLTKEAFNALLKTLEEPPEHVIFILATTEPHKVPATVLSRCERFVFYLATDTQLDSLLDRIAKNEGIKVDKEAKEVLISQANGSFRDLLSVLDPVFSSAKDNHVTKDLAVSMLGLFDSSLIQNFLQSIFNLNVKTVENSLTDIKLKAGNVSAFLQSLINTIRHDISNYHKTSKFPQYYLDASYADVIKFLSLLIAQSTQIRFLPTDIIALELAVYEYLSYKLSGSAVVNEKYSDSDSSANLLNANVLSDSAVNDSIVNDLTVNEVSDVKNESEGVLDLKQEDKNLAEDAKKEDVKVSNISDVKDTADSNVSLEFEVLQATSKPKSAGLISSTTSVDSSLADTDAKVNIDADAGKSSGCSLDAIKTKWSTFLLHVKKNHGPLYAILSVSEPVGVVDADGKVKLKLAVSYQYHKNKIEEAGTQVLLRKLFEQIYNRVGYFVAVVSKSKVRNKSNKDRNNSLSKLDTQKDVPSTKKTPESSVDPIADVFGAELDV